MERYNLTTGKIDNKFSNIEIYPFSYSNFEYLISWNNSEAGVIKKIADLWIAEEKALRPFVNEIGSFIDSHGVRLN